MLAVSRNAQLWQTSTRRYTHTEPPGLSLKRIFRHLPQHVVVVTAAVPESGITKGITVSSFTTLSIDPPRVLFNVKMPSSALRAINSGFVAQLFSYNEKNIFIAKHFAMNEQDRRPLSFPKCFLSDDTENADGITANDVTYISCSLDRLIEVDDHCIVIGLVQAVRELGPQPQTNHLFYRNHKFVPFHESQQDE